MKICVVGLGYVGAVSLACFHSMSHQVIGCDIKQHKVDSIKKGIAPIKEKGLDDLMEGGLQATTDINKALDKSKIIFLCLGTPDKGDGTPDLKYLRRVCKNISLYMNKHKKEFTIVIRSTIFPGVYDKMKEVLERYSGKKEGTDFHLVLNPEFLREGTAIKDFFNPPYIILGTNSNKIAEQIFECYKEVTGKRIVTEPNVAQMIKYVNNSWHALKVTFANEIGSICSKLNINSQELMDIFCCDKQLNLSSYYLSPGFAYGGSCLSKDTNALINKSETLKVKTPLLHSIPKSNDEHILRGLNRIANTRKRKIGFLGISFKAGTDDQRNNPVLDIIQLLKQDPKMNVEIYDEHIPGSDLNRVLNQDLIVVSARDKKLLKIAEDSGKVVINLQKW